LSVDRDVVAGVEDHCRRLIGIYHTIVDEGHLAGAELPRTHDIAGVDQLKPGITRAPYLIIAVAAEDDAAGPLDDDDGAAEPQIREVPGGVQFDRTVIGDGAGQEEPAGVC